MPKATPPTPKPTAGAASGSSAASLAEHRKAAAERFKASPTGSKAPTPKPNENPLVKLLEELQKKQSQPNASKETKGLMKLLNAIIEEGTAQAVLEGKPMAKDTHANLQKSLAFAKGANSPFPKSIQKLAGKAHDFVNKHQPGPNAGKEGSKSASLMKDALSVMSSTNPTAAGISTMVGKMKDMGACGKISAGFALATGGLTAAVLGPVAGAVVGAVVGGTVRGLLGIGQLIKKGIEKAVDKIKGSKADDTQKPATDLETDPTRITSASTDPNAAPQPEPEAKPERTLDHEAKEPTQVNVADPTSITSSSTAGQDQPPGHDDASDRTAPDGPGIEMQPMGQRNLVSDRASTGANPPTQQADSSPPSLN
ncbi:MAG: hypothetical protein P1U63_05585 [Coxiellaceae bacterium]|nr:hypothetical protein [Coxiellaceae bacterium]